jgi:NADPH-dependent 2,4-dienoyl-CoA reductase/sulfur reductase-like enzyme
VVEAGVVVLATGVAPNTGWLAGSGLGVDDGLVLDEFCRAGTAARVVGAGDVARWFNPLFGRAMRVEHWTNAGQQADVAARSLLAFDSPPAAYEAVPYFWTHLYGQHLQFVGVTTDTARLVDEAGDRTRFVVEYVRQDHVLGALCVNFAGRVPRYRRAIRSGLATLAH